MHYLMHLNSKLLFKKYAIKYFDKKFRVLEIAPDFPSVFQQLTLSITPHWDTLDIYDNKSLTYPNSNPYNFPIDANSYDIIFSAQVLEHVRMPWKWMPELARVCKKGGLIITINPVSWPYHEAPVDCWRIYPEGMRALSEESNLTVLESHWESLGVIGSNTTY